MADEKNGNKGKPPAKPAAKPKPAKKPDAPKKDAKDYVATLRKGHSYRNGMQTFWKDKPVTVTAKDAKYLVATNPNFEVKSLKEIEAAKVATKQLKDDDDGAGDGAKD